MKPKTVGLMLAVGLFLLALVVAVKPRAIPSWAEHHGGTQLTPTIKGLAAKPTAKLSPVSPLPIATPTLMPTISATPGSAGDSKMVVAFMSNTAGEADVNAATAGPRDAQVDVGKVRVMLHDYHTLMHENPVGTNAEIMQTLLGGNPRQAKLGPPEGMTLNAQGELIDQWNTPYFFHQLSKDVMEIRSAGPDKVMWTADDVIAR